MGEFPPLRRGNCPVGVKRGPSGRTYGIEGRLVATDLMMINLSSSVMQRYEDPHSRSGVSPRFHKSIHNAARLTSRCRSVYICLKASL